MWIGNLDISDGVRETAMGSGEIVAYLVCLYLKEASKILCREGEGFIHGVKCYR